MTDETVQDRLERAQSQSMDVTLVDTDPVVVQVYNEDSDRIHTVVPDSVHCSCEDHTYRGTICKHLLELLDTQGHIGEVTRDALVEHRNDLEVLSDTLQEQIGEIEAEITEIRTALDAVDASHVRAQTATDVVEAADDYDADDADPVMTEEEQDELAEIEVCRAESEDRRSEACRRANGDPEQDSTVGNPQVAQDRSHTADKRSESEFAQMVNDMVGGPQ